MTKKFIDLSVTIEHELPSDPPGMLPKIQYVDHEMGGQTMKAFFPGVEAKDLPKVRRSFAQKWQAFASAGWWIQDVAGNWNKR